MGFSPFCWVRVLILYLIGTYSILLFWIVFAFKIIFSVTDTCGCNSIFFLGRKRHLGTDFTFNVIYNL
jgi:hypothetical protein